MTTATAKTATARNVMITDLDESDEGDGSSRNGTGAGAGDGGDGDSSKHKHSSSQPMIGVQRRAAQKKRQLNTLAGNFNRRSRNAECCVQQKSNATDKEHFSGSHKAEAKEKAHGYVKDLLQTKERQLEKLVERLSTLHKYNEQFATENQQLRQHVDELEEQVEGLRREISDCQGCQRLSQRLSECADMQKLQKNDVAMLKTLVYRLNVQIESYQDQLRILRCATETQPQSPTGVGPSKSGTDFSPSARQSSSVSQWQLGALCTNTLSPLLTAYDEMLRDKEQLIQQYRHEFENFTGELKRSVEENSRLLEQYESLKREFGNWQEERTRLKAQVEVCRGKAETQAHKSDLAKEKLVEVMHCYEQKLQTVTLDLEHVQSAYTRCKTELAALKSLNVQPQQTAQQQESITSSLQECKVLLEQLRQEHSKEKQKLQCSVTEHEKRRKSDELRVMELQQENAKLRGELQSQRETTEELEKRAASLQRSADLIKQSRDRLKARLRIALQWAQKLEVGQANIQSTWDALKRLETIVKHKESQVRGLHARHLQEIEKMERKLAAKDDTIRTILKSKLASNDSNENVLGSPSG